MTGAREHHAQWRRMVANVLQFTRRQGSSFQMEVDFYTAVLALLDGQASTLPPDHPYAPALAEIQAGIAAGGHKGGNTRVEAPDEVDQAIRNFLQTENWGAARSVLEARQAFLFRPEAETRLEYMTASARTLGDEHTANTLEGHLIVLRACKAQGIEATFKQLATVQQKALAFDAALISRSITVLLGGPQEKMAHVQYLTTLIAQATGDGVKALAHEIQLALFGGNLSQLGQNLTGVYREAWRAIVMGVETEGVDSDVLDTIAHNTLAVLGSAADQRDEWHANLTQIRDQAKTEGAEQFVALVNAVIALLDAGGHPDGLGTGLTGRYARTWQQIAEQLP